MVMEARVRSVFHVSLFHSCHVSSCYVFLSMTKRVTLSLIRKIVLKILQISMCVKRQKVQYRYEDRYIHTQVLHRRTTDKATLNFELTTTSTCQPLNNINFA
jgi:hypothetical protein